MAKKKTEERSYLQLPLPSGKKYYKMAKRSWAGLNMRQTIDTGALTMEKNISTLEAPYLVPSQEWENVGRSYRHPISMFGFGDFLLVIYRDDAETYGAIKVDYIENINEDEFDEEYDNNMRVYTSFLKQGTIDEPVTDEDDYPRCVVQFNVYNTPTDPLSGEFVKKLLIFPDKKSMAYELEDLTQDENLKNYDDRDFCVYDMDVLVREYTNSEKPYLPPDTANHSYYYRNTSEEAIEADNLYGSAIYRWVEDESDSGNSGWKISIPPSMPDIKYATVHLSRLFGVDDTRVYASGYNDYTNWNLDTVEEYNESNAWCTPAQSNTKAGGKFTGITTFQNHVVCFKEDFMHEIYNTKNPFRIQDIYAEGAIDNRTIQDVDGNLIFVSKDAVKVYTGGNPSILSYYLDIGEYKNAVSGTDGRCYYLYCEDETGKKRMLTYDSMIGQWSEQKAKGEVKSFAHNKRGMYALCANGYIYRLDSGLYDEWAFETDLITNETVDIKHVKKIQMLADIGRGSELSIYILYGDEEFDEDASHKVFSATGGGRRTIRVKPRKTAHYGIKIHVGGKGYVKLYEMEIFFEAGGPLYG